LLLKHVVKSTLRQVDLDDGFIDEDDDEGEFT
jgi:hypothetical protein